MEELVLTSEPTKGKKLIAELRGVFNENKILPKEFEAMVHSNNLMASRQLKANPYFFKYIEAAVELKNNKNCQAQFLAWHDVIDGFLKNTKGKTCKPLKAFLDFSIPFFKDGTLRFSKSGTSWTATLEDFKMSYSASQAQIYFTKTHLAAQSKKGDIEIEETSGTFFPLKNKWKGKGGKASWEKNHPSLKEVYCELGNYDLNTKKGFYKADSVQFFYPKLFSDKSVLGKLEHKITATKKDNPSSYPQFESYDHALDLGGLIKNSTLTGGVKLIGSEVHCYGDADTPAKWVQMNSSGGKYFEISSNEIIIKNQKEFFANQAATKIYFEENFIYHPSVEIKYLDLEKTMIANAVIKGQSQGPFYDEYHQVNIYAPRLDVKFNEKEIIINQKKFNVGNKTHRVTFESKGLWNEKEFARIKAFSKVNPIILMAVLSKREGKRKFSVDEIVETLKFQDKPSALTGLFVDLRTKGFINYFPARKEVVVLDKALHYFEVKEAEKDFDQLMMRSEFDKTNAVFDMKKKEIEMEGVSVLEFSNKRKVAVEPLDQKMTLKKNRALDFSGRIYAGTNILTGKKFHFDYDKFHIVMDSIEHIDVFTKDEFTPKGGKENFSSLGSRIEGASGILRIDDPANKSGREEIEGFPRFESTSSSYVYYDSKEIQKGKFVRDSFYFELDKFTLKSMGEISKDDLKFKGKLFSHGVFPEFETVLELTDGEILGFKKQLPQGGLPLYEGKGNFAGQVTLDENGLQGEGKVKFNTTTFQSDNINFLPQKLTATTNDFQIKNRGGEHPLPLVNGDSAQVSWTPNQDTMIIVPKGSPFRLFPKQKHEFEGELVLTADSLAGKGIMNWDLGILKSDEIRFSENGIQSDFADLTFRNRKEKTIAIDTKNISANISFGKNIGSFKSQKKKGTIDFPTNKYETTLLDFDWDMGNEIVTFNSAEKDFGKFTSTHSEKDSLSFMGKTAAFDLNTGLLQIGGVVGISTADSWVELLGEKITVGKTGEMETLQNVTVFAGEKNKFHALKNAEVEIIGKNKFTGRGNYEYVLESKKQVIQNLEIEGDLFGKGKKAKLKTEANGIIEEEDNFFIKEKINFHGDVSLNSHSEDVNFKGFAQMQTMGNHDMHWFEMEHHTLKNDSTIAFTSPKNPEGESLHTGIFISREFRTLYPKVMMPLLSTKDRSIFKSIGVLKISEDGNSFLLGDSTKVSSPQNLGNIIQFPTGGNDIVAIGKFDVDTFLNPIKLKIVGKATISFLEKSMNENTRVDTSDFQIKALAGLDIPLPKSLMKIILTDIQASSFDALDNVQKDRDFFLNVLPEFLNDPKALSKTFKILTTNQVLVLPEKKNKHTFLLSDMNLKWDMENQSFISTKDQLGLVSINGTPVNNLLTGYFQLKLMSNENDQLYFYLKSPSGNFYYFGFKNGILDTSSNNEKYNETVSDLKKKERQIKMKDGELFEIMLASGGSANNFVNRAKRMQQVYQTK